MNYYKIKSDNINDLEYINEKINNIQELLFEINYNIDLDLDESNYRYNKKNKILKANFYVKKCNNKELNIECPICYINILPTNNKTLLCSHNLCKDCYSNWFKTCFENKKYITCPICRK